MKVTQGLKTKEIITQIIWSFSWTNISVTSAFAFINAQKPNKEPTMKGWTHSKWDNSWQQWTTFNTTWNNTNTGNAEYMQIRCSVKSYSHHTLTWGPEWQWTRRKFSEKSYCWMPNHNRDSITITPSSNKSLKPHTRAGNVLTSFVQY